MAPVKFRKIPIISRKIPIIIYYGYFSNYLVFFRTNLESFMLDFADFLANYIKFKLCMSELTKENWGNLRFRIRQLRCIVIRTWVDCRVCKVRQSDKAKPLHAWYIDLELLGHWIGVREIVDKYTWVCWEISTLYILYSVFVLMKYASMLVMLIVMCIMCLLYHFWWNGIL